MKTIKFSPGKTIQGTLGRRLSVTKIGILFKESQFMYLHYLDNSDKLKNDNQVFSRKNFYDDCPHTQRVQDLIQQNRDSVLRIPISALGLYRTFITRISG